MKAERVFESMLWRARFFALIPVVFMLLAAIAASVQGAATVFGGVAQGLAGDRQGSVLSYLTALDTFLLSTIFYVACVGLYELFVSKLDGPDARTPHPRLPAWMMIRTLEDLKHRLTSVVTVIIAIIYLTELTRWSEGESRVLGTPLDVLWLSLGVAVAIASLTLFSRQISEHADRAAALDAQELP